MCGPTDPVTHNSKTYCLTVIDDFSHFCKVYPLKIKKGDILTIVLFIFKRMFSGEIQ